MGISEVRFWRFCIFSGFTFGSAFLAVRFWQCVFGSVFLAVFGNAFLRFAFLVGLRFGFSMGSNTKKKQKKIPEFLLVWVLVMMMIEPCYFSFDS